MDTSTLSKASAAALALALGLAGSAAAEQRSPQAAQPGVAAAPQPGGDPDHAAHHPENAQGGGAAQAQATPGPAPAAPQQPPPPRGGGAPGAGGGGQAMPMAPAPGGPEGGMPGGMPGMMGGGDMGQMMMQMMQRMMAARAGGAVAGPGALRPFQRVEGQLAYFRTELRITDSQMPQWNAFADAMRAAGERLRQAYTEAMQAAQGPAATAPQQLERQIALLAVQLETTRAAAAALAPLYAALSDEQKRIADELMAEHLRDMRRSGL
jgi:hypothetical protein